MYEYGAYRNLCTAMFLQKDKCSHIQQPLFMLSEDCCLTWTESISFITAAKSLFRFDLIYALKICYEYERKSVWVVVYLCTTFSFCFYRKIGFRLICKLLVLFKHGAEQIHAIADDLFAYDRAKDE